MMRFKRKKNGRFDAKSAEDRKVRSIRATDSAWESLGDLAESQNMSRADLMEQLVQDGKLDIIQGLETLRAIAQALDAQPETASPQLLASTLTPDQELEPIQELAGRLEPLQDLVEYVEGVQTLVKRLEPVQQLVQQLEPVKDLAEKLEPLQILAQQLKPLSEVDRLQSLAEQVEVIQSVVQQLEDRSEQQPGDRLVLDQAEEEADESTPSVFSHLPSSDQTPTLNALSDSDVNSRSQPESKPQRWAIALQLVHQFREERLRDRPTPNSDAPQPDRLQSNSQQLASQLPSTANPTARDIRLSEFEQWLIEQFQSG